MTGMSTFTPDPNDVSLPLGRETPYPNRYDPTLLYPISRSMGRSAIGLNGQPLPFVGWDLWRGYEASWLSPTGLPRVALLKIWVPASSPNIVESKSFKLYLNSLNNESFKSSLAVVDLIKQDVSQAIQADVQVQLVESSSFASEQIEEPDESTCLDAMGIEINDYQPNASLLATKSGTGPVKEKVFSRLLKSNCPVTGQPDWASVHIDYTGQPIDHASLLRYIVSFRQHQGFHEQCVEQIFCDIMQQCQPSALSVYARYTRRGGLDINPWRATPDMTAPNLQRSAQQ
jgi:7-cyano-7-deazaguanine reductase